MGRGDRVGFVKVVAKVVGKQGVHGVVVVMVGKGHAGPPKNPPQLEYLF